MDAIYARQSVEKVDSISIESQLEYCRHEARGNPCREYIDRGYSGRNTNRPAFEQLLADAAADLPGAGPADPDTTTAETTAGTTATKES